MLEKLSLQQYGAGGVDGHGLWIQWDLVVGGHYCTRARMPSDIEACDKSRHTPPHRSRWNTVNKSRNRGSSITKTRTRSSSPGKAVRTEISRTRSIR